VRRIVANLLCEDELAKALPVPGSHIRSLSPPNAVLATVSRMAMLLRVFAQPGDRLWLPGPPADEAGPRPGPRSPTLEWGPLAELAPATAVLAWCETPDVLAHRGAAGGEATPLAIEPALDAPFPELLWSLPKPLAETVARVHHREFALELGHRLGCALPGAQMVASLQELDRLALPRSWVLKAPLSAAGRHRYIERNGPRLADAKARRTVERLFWRHGPLLLEPWMDRVRDYGVSAILVGDRLRIVGVHGQRVDRKGQFVGIDLEPALEDRDRAALLETTAEVAAALQAAAYVGPFGIDAWRYRTENGELAFHPLGEINARMTFGLVAWAEAEREGRVPSTLK
jgi:hypothetical protein